MSGLVRLVYFSRAPARFDIRSVLRIVETARANNARFDITGALLFSHDCFVQALEGSADVVNALYRKILVDDRHREPTLLEYLSVAERVFGEWSMAFCSQEKVTRDLVRQFSGNDTLQPSQLSGDDAIGLLRAVTQQASDRAQHAGPGRSD